MRVVFQKNGEDWQAFPSGCPDSDCLKSLGSEYPPEVKWNIAFDGRDLGQVTAHTPSGFKFYSDIGLQEITSATPIPVIGKRSIEYSGFQEFPVYRPLVANSQPNFKDPEAWKPATLSTHLIQVARKHFRQKFPTAYNCTGENIQKPWAYRDDDIEVTKAYASKKRWVVVQMTLAEYHDGHPADDNCGNPIQDNNDPFLDQWFVISPADEVTFLDAGMWLIDAGDYDNSGKSELMFSINRYNRGGYELFYDNFKKRAVFEFGYH